MNPAPNESRPPEAESTPVLRIQILFQATDPAAGPLIDRLEALGVVPVSVLITKKVVGNIECRENRDLDRVDRRGMLSDFSHLAVDEPGEILNVFRIAVRPHAVVLAKNLDLRCTRFLFRHDFGYGSRFLCPGNPQLLPPRFS